MVLYSKKFNQFRKENEKNYIGSQLQRNFRILSSMQNLRFLIKKKQNDKLNNYMSKRG